MPDALAPRFNKRRFIVEIETDDTVYLELTPVATSDAGEGLQSEIRSNLESLQGVAEVIVRELP